MLIDLSLQKIVSKFKQRVHTLLMLFAIIYVGFAAVDVLASDDIKNIEKKIDEQRAILDELENQLDRVAGERENKIDKPALPNASSAALILDKHPNAAIGRGEDFIDPDFSKSVPLFDSDWRFAMGGYAKVDLIHDFSGGDEYEFILASIPVDSDPQPGSFSRLQMNETRINFEMRNRAAGIPYNRVFFEFDFFDKSSPLSPRLRHAYFEYGSLLVGRTWTTLTELRQLPLLLDFAAGDSLFGGRTTQIRWTDSSAGPFDWAVALEDYPDDSIYNPLNLEGTARADFPRLVLRGSYKWNHGVVMIGGAMNQLRFDGDGTQDDTSELGWACVTGGRIYIDPSDRHFFGFGASYGEGTAQDIIAFANGGVPNATLNADGSLELADAWNLQLSLHWEWTDKWSSNFNYAIGRLSNVPALYEPDYMREGSAVHGNIIYKVNDVITTGVEYMVGKRENVSGSDGTAERLMMSIFYYF